MGREEWVAKNDLLSDSVIRQILPPITSLSSQSITSEFTESVPHKLENSPSVRCKGRLLSPPPSAA
jgi:hypothetical protein